MRSGDCMHIKLIAAAILILPSASRAAIPEATRATIDQLTGAIGVYTVAEDVYKVSFPRTDFKPTIEGRPASPFLGFGSWAAFTPAHGSTMVMGDIVLLQDEVNPAMSAALD